MPGHEGAVVPTEAIGRALAIAQQQLADGMTVAQLAREIGYGRSAVSLFVRGVYHAQPAHMAAAVLDRFSRLTCPYLKTEITPVQCAALATRPCPTCNAREVRHWKACQTCAHKTTLTGENK